tara:strand:+ start:449 stop:901 length:453 start_codon:yes stop_codon:yes gene_type:complete
MKITMSRLKEIIREELINEKVFGSQAQYDAYRKKHNLKPGSKVKVAGKTVTVRGKGKMSKKAKSAADSIAAKLNAKMDALNKKRKDGKVKEGNEKIPGELKRYMDRFLDKLKDRNLVRAKKKEVIKQVLKNLDISPKELMMYIQRVKKEI